MQSERRTLAFVQGRSEKNEPDPGLKKVGKVQVNAPNTVPAKAFFNFT